MYKGMLPMSEVSSACALSPSTIRRRIEEGKFPRSINLGGRRVAWRIKDIEAWICDPSAFNASRPESLETMGGSKS